MQVKDMRAHIFDFEGKIFLYKLFLSGKIYREHDYIIYTFSKTKKKYLKKTVEAR